MVTTAGRFPPRPTAERLQLAYARETGPFVTLKWPKTAPYAPFANTNARA